MAKKVNTDLIEARRERVSYWRLRGKSQREVVRLLEEEGLINPETKKPFGLTAINGDCEALRVTWREAQSEAISDAKGTVLAELRAVRAAAWEGAANIATIKALLESLEDDDNGEVRKEAAKALGRISALDYGAILTSIKQETQLLGLDAPTKTMALDPKAIDGMTDDELAEAEAKLLKMAGHK